MRVEPTATPPVHKQLAAPVSPGLARRGHAIPVADPRDAAGVRAAISDAQREGKRARRRVQIPCVAVALLGFAFGAAIAAKLGRTDSTAIVLAPCALTGSAVLLLFAVLPSDERSIMLAASSIAVQLLLTAALIIVVGLLPSLRALFVARPCTPPDATCSLLVVDISQFILGPIVLFSAAGYSIWHLAWRRSRGRALLEVVWCGVVGVCRVGCFILTVLTVVRIGLNGGMSLRIARFFIVGAWFGLLDLSISRLKLRIRVQSALASRGEALLTAAAVAAFIGERADAAEMVRRAQASFRAVPLSRVLQSHFESQDPDAALHALSTPVALGQCDVFCQVRARARSPWPLPPSRAVRPSAVPALCAPSAPLPPLCNGHAPLPRPPAPPPKARQCAVPHRAARAPQLARRAPLPLPAPRTPFPRPSHSHSWSDDAGAKYAALSAWGKRFERRHARVPMVWIDRTRQRGAHPAPSLARSDESGVPLTQTLTRPCDCRTWTPPPPPLGSLPCFSRLPLRHLHRPDVGGRCGSAVAMLPGRLQRAARARGAVVPQSALVHYRERSCSTHSHSRGRRSRSVRHVRRVVCPALCLVNARTRGACPLPRPRPRPRSSGGMAQPRPHPSSILTPRNGHSNDYSSTPLLKPSPRPLANQPNPSQEIFVFVSMGAPPTAIEVAMLTADLHIDDFNAMEAQCTHSSDRQRMLCAVESAAGGISGFNRCCAKPSLRPRAVMERAPPDCALHAAGMESALST